MKRKTKAQREAEAKDALQQRIQDIYSGACGRRCSDGDDWPSLEEVARVIPAIRETFGEPVKDWLGWRAHNLGKFESVGAATEYLFDHGFRADEQWGLDDG